jgi:t-SNARE complex subunit (syntaxin)
MSDENYSMNPVYLMQKINRIKDQIQQLEQEVHQVTVHQCDRIHELESLVHPYSGSGMFVGDIWEENDNFDE